MTTSTAARSLLTAHLPTAPAVFVGVQEGFGHVAAIELYNLTADIAGHNTGSTVSRQTLEAAGYFVISPVDRAKRRAAWFRRNHDYARASLAA